MTWSFRSFLASSILLISILPLECHAQCAGLTGSADDEAKPFAWRKSETDQLLSGAIPDFATVISGELILPMSVKYVGPWARAQNDLEAGKIDLLWGAFRNKEREEYADFVPTPLTRVRSVVLSRQDDSWQFSKLSDLEKRRGLLTRGESYGVEFDAYAAERLSITRVGKIENAITMILKNRADYLVVDETIARIKLASMANVAIRVSENEVTGQDLLLLVSKRSRCNTPELRDRLNKALLVHKKNRTFDKLLRNYLTQ